MSALSRRVTTEFCKACSWAYEVWAMRRTLFDDNPDIDSFSGSKHAPFLHYLSTITQEYALHQLIKLHDPAVQGKSINLSIDYVVEFGGWDSATADHLRKLRAQLEMLADHIRRARNKVLAHNDLAAILTAEPLGSFPAGADTAYFEALQELANIVHDKTVGGPYPFPNQVKTDVHLLLSALAADGALDKRPPAV